MNKAISILEAYGKLYDRFGPQHWWPGDTAFEVIVGAILTQNTAWTNVEKAIANLKGSGALSSPRAMKRLRRTELAKLIRPAGYYNIKAGRIGNFLDLLEEGYGLDLDRMQRLKTDSLREELISVNGIGPETCDSILLYAFDRPTFVVDAYTRRIFSRHGLFGMDAGYDEIKALFEANLRRRARLFNEYHALIVRIGKDYCRKHPKCGSCPLHGFKIACK